MKITATFTKAKAPISASVRQQLKQDAQNIKAVAERKQVTLDRYEESREKIAALNHFELGCWLYYFKDKVGLAGEAGLSARVECALRIFLSRINNPGYDFFTVFDFGERQFDTIFEMGDSTEVLAQLRLAAKSDRSGSIASAFAHFGWKLENC